MEAGPSGTRPPKRLCSQAVQELINNISDDEDYGILSEDDIDPVYSDESETSSSSSSDSEEENVVTSRKGALPSTSGRGKKIAARVQRRPGRPTTANRPSEEEEESDIDTEEVVDDNDFDLGPAVDTAWRQVDAGQTTNSFRFVRNNSTGINPDLSNSSTPVEFLFALLNEDIIEQLIQCINDYAQQLCAKNNPPRRYSVFAKFTPVTRDEFLRFLAILLAMGLNPRYSIRCYWSHQPHMNTPWFRQTMPRKRFEAIFHTFLHAGGVDAEKQDKIEPFLEKLMVSFQKAYYPSKDLSIDEMVIGFKGRWKNKQFNATKPSKYHIKTFGLCDSGNGYVYNLFTYYGSDTAYHPNLDPNALQAIKVFEKLLRPLEKGHHIFGDRFYTSMPLLNFLQSRGFHYTGTVDVRRKNFPPALKSLKLDFLGMQWFMNTEDSLLTVAFRDKKAKKNVVVVTSDGSVETTEVRRRREVVQKPSCIDMYNQKMNGCDRADQCVQYYGMHKRRSYKWWKKIFHFLLELSVINASILFNIARGSQDTAFKRWKLCEFKNALIEELCNAVASERVARVIPVEVPAINRLAPNNHMMESVKNDRNCRVCSGPGKRKRTVNVCATCPGRPYLCRKDCFKIWHTRLNLNV